MSKIAFRCVCNEPSGPVERTVRVLEFTPDNLRKLFDQVKKFKTFMGYEVNSMDDMIKVFLTPELQPKGLCMVVDEFVGIFWLTDINGLHEASVHYTFFDRRHRGRVELCKAAIAYSFTQFGFHRLSTAVPEYESKVAHFVKNEIGFVYTGRLRQNRVIRDKVYDTLLFDLLREEFLNGISSGELFGANITSPESSQLTEVPASTGV